MKDLIFIICIISLSLNGFGQERLIKSQKSLSVKIIGTSANAYTAIYHAANWLDVDPVSNTILFTHRQGGAWGGISSNLYFKYSNDYGITWDSLEFISPIDQKFRYPNSVLYNPNSFTNRDSLYVITAGPCTNGTNWVSNYFGSKKIYDINVSIEYFPLLSIDTSIMARINLCRSSDKFFIGSTVTDNNTNENLKYIIFNGVFNTVLKKVDWSSTPINTLFRKRSFSTGKINWDANPNLAFANDGLKGYFYSFGADSLDDPYYTSIPVIWETTDGGVSWTKNIYHHFDNLKEIRKKIYPTIASQSNSDTSQWIYRPDFLSGAYLDEGNYPGIVDMLGNLHIAVLIEGRPSSHPDSLNLKYHNHPHLLFDLIKNDTGWNAIFIDTIKSDVVDPLAFGFPYGAVNPYDMDHWIRITKNNTGSKIFILWTDTDPNIDTTNILPQLKAWGYDILSNFKTQTKSFTTTIGNIVCLQVPHIVITEGATYKIPCTYIDPFDNGVDITLPVKHYFLSGVEFNESDFIPVSINSGNNYEFSYKIFPNPFSDQFQIFYKLTKPSDISIEIYNSVGSKIKTVCNGWQFDGDYKKIVQISENGIYFIKFTIDKQNYCSKIIKF